MHGPSLPGEQVPLPPLEDRFKLMAYCDDVKPSVTSMSEFLTIDKACSLFENSSGCKLHRDPASGKCKFLPLSRWKGTLQQEDIPLRYMTISDSLDMVGVVLKSTWVQTRKANGEIVQARVSNTVNAWKSGKFMDLTSRPWSLNSYALSKVWFKCHTVDLRITDITNLTSKVKSWLFQDQLEKPEEMILFRPIDMGGLGLHNVRYKAKASMIRTFMETAIHPFFSHSLFHNLLYRANVLCDETISVSSPPYFSAQFFDSIKWVKDNTPLNVTTMTTAEWYRVLVEKEITMIEPMDQPGEYIKSKSELASPDNDWEISWRRSRIKGIGSEASSFLWKLLHRLLPTEMRLARILPNSSPNCKFCQVQISADLEHCFFECILTREVGQQLLTMFQAHDANISAPKLLRLEFQVDEPKEMPLVWILAHTLLYMWGVRLSGKAVTLFLTRAQLESKINILRETRYRDEHLVITEMFDLL